jgi:hypothetical protein
VPRGDRTGSCFAMELVYSTRARDTTRRGGLGRGLD